MTRVTHKGWTIDVDPVMGVLWFATGPDYDASYEGPEDGWVDNGQKVAASTFEELVQAIDDFEAELQVIGSDT